MKEYNSVVYSSVRTSFSSIVFVIVAKYNESEITFRWTRGLTTNAILDVVSGPFRLQFIYDDWDVYDDSDIRLYQSAIMENSIPFDSAMRAAFAEMEKWAIQFN